MAQSESTELDAVPSQQIQGIPPPILGSDGNILPGCASPGLPPTYEQALTHRTIEYNQFSLPGSYPEPSSGIPAVEPRIVQTGDGVEMGMSPDTRDSCMEMTFPPMHMCMAVTCGICNFIVPGLGESLQLQLLKRWHRPSLDVHCLTGKEACTTSVVGRSKQYNWQNI